MADFTRNEWRSTGSDQSKHFSTFPRFFSSIFHFHFLSIFHSKFGNKWLPTPKALNAADRVSHFEGALHKIWYFWLPSNVCKNFNGKYTNLDIFGFCLMFAKISRDILHKISYWWLLSSVCKCCCRVLALDRSSHFSATYVVVFGSAPCFSSGKQRKTGKTSLFFLKTSKNSWFFPKISKTSWFFPKTSKTSWFFPKTRKN